jgi:hypothetical protein
MATPTIASVEANLIASYAGRIAQREPGLFRLFIASRDVEVRIVYHEAAHAVISLAVGQSPHGACIRESSAGSGFWGFVHYAPEPPAGYSEMQSLGSDRKNEDRDLRMLWLLLGSPSIWVLRARAKELRQATLALVREHWPEIRAVALALLERRTLTGAEIQAILGDVRKDGVRQK